MNDPGAIRKPSRTSEPDPSVLHPQPLTDLFRRGTVGLLCDLGVDTERRLRIGVAKADLRCLDVDTFFDQKRRGSVFQVMEGQIAQPGPTSGRKPDAPPPVGVMKWVAVRRDKDERLGIVSAHTSLGQIRHLLAVLAGAAAETGAAIVMIRHHNKANGSPALYRGGGSIGIIGAARAAYAVIRDPDDAGHRLLATVKSNLAQEVSTWGYSLVDVPDLGVARIEWDQQADPRNASELLAGTQTPALAEAVAWLTDWRAEHPGPVPAAELLDAATKAGIATATLHRARKQLGLKTRKTADGWTLQ